MLVASPVARAEHPPYIINAITTSSEALESLAVVDYEGSDGTPGSRQDHGPRPAAWNNTVRSVLGKSGTRRTLLDSDKSLWHMI